MRSWGQQQSSIFENMPINRRYSRKRNGKRITCTHIPENVNLCYASKKFMQEVLIEKPLHHWCSVYLCILTGSLDTGPVTKYLVPLVYWEIVIAVVCSKFLHACTSSLIYQVYIALHWQDKESTSELPQRLAYCHLYNRAERFCWKGL